MKLHHILSAAAAMWLCSCSNNAGWSVSGTIENAPEGSKVAIEGFNAGRWYNIDSVALDSKGSFSYTAETGAPYPDVYRIGMDGRNIYFPIDSLDKITVHANASAFDTDFTIEGSPAAATIMNIDKKIASEVNARGVQSVLADSILKTSLNQAILDDTIGVVAFYVLNKSLGGEPLYSPTNRRDVAMLGATAQKFASLRPADPRTKILEQQFIAARKLHSEARTVVEAASAGLLDITLYDEKGKEVDLKTTAETSPLTILSFTTYALDTSLPYNVILNKIYDKYASRGVKIYQVGFDTDEVAWRTTAANLPWLTVFCHSDSSAPLIGSYNVTSLPMSYIINGEGEVVKRVADPAELESEVNKLLK